MGRLKTEIQRLEIEMVSLREKKNSQEVGFRYFIIELKIRFATGSISPCYSLNKVLDSDGGTVLLAFFFLQCLKCLSCLYPNAMGCGNGCD